VKESGSRSQQTGGVLWAAWWILPSLLCLALHWLAFRAWFRADDFAWLGLTPQVHSFHDLLVALFEPRAQGTIRPWSERAFFMAGYALFGLNALPYRIVIFATEFAALGLMAWIGRRLTGSPAAGFLAALFWICNSSGMEPLGWACVYNEVMCAFFLLLAFYFLLRYTDTGQHRYEIYQWVAFILGFGALELNVVYPAIAAGYTLLCARKHFRRTLPLFGASAIYAVAHTIAAPFPTSGDYAMHFDGSMFRTLGILWTWTVGPTYRLTPLSVPAWVVPAGVMLVSVAIVALAARKWRSGVALFCLLWFLVTIGPVLPLRDHISEYYGYIPVIGLCWLGGWGVVSAWSSGIGVRVAVVALSSVYLLLQIPHLEASTKWNYTLTVRTRNLVEGVAGAHELHPNQSILLYGMDAELFWNGMHDYPFRLLRIDNVYLAPGSEKNNASDPGWDGVGEFILPSSAVNRGLSQNELVVYDVRGTQLHNMTSLYAAMARSNELPLRIDAGNPLNLELLGPEWYRPEVDHRWMPKRATVRLGGPAVGGRNLYLRGNCSEKQLRSGDLQVTVTVDGATLPAGTIHDTSFEIGFPLPAAVVGKPELRIAIEVSRIYHPPADSRDLGLAFGVIEIR
jgi:hypothetical protein